MASTLQKLRQANPSATDAELRIWLDAFTKYQKAEQSLRKTGLLGKDKNDTIIENPLLKIQERLAKMMDECGRVKNTEFLWNEHDEQ